ncbi:unnamed protein product [Prunus armeniaca]
MEVNALTIGREDASKCKDSFKSGFNEMSFLTAQVMKRLITWSGLWMNQFLEMDEKKEVIDFFSLIRVIDQARHPGT